MKTRSALLALTLLGVSSSFATVTLQFTLQATGVAANWANSSGVGGLNLAWGIIIDTNGNGFDNSYFPGINFGAGGSSQTLTLPNGGASDDLLFLSTFLMPTPPITADGNVPGSNLVTTIPNIVIGPFGVNSGDAFEIVWFDRTALSGTSVHGESFGSFFNPAFILPADGSTVPYASVFTGPDPLKPMTHSLIPEPSSFLLGLLGLGGLLRRRR